MLLRVLILFTVYVCTSWEYDVISLAFTKKKERRHKSYKICIVDKSFIQLQFHEANILIGQLFGQQKESSIIWKYSLFLVSGATKTSSFY